MRKGEDSLFATIRTNVGIKSQTIGSHQLFAKTKQQPGFAYVVVQHKEQLERTIVFHQEELEAR